MTRKCCPRGWFGPKLLLLFTLVFLILPKENSAAAFLMPLEQHSTTCRSSNSRSYQTNPGQNSYAVREGNCEDEEESTLSSRSFLLFQEKEKVDDIPSSTRRRQAMKSATFTTTTIMATLLLFEPDKSNAAMIGFSSLFEEKPERQLELCIVSLLRIIYWAERALKDFNGIDDVIAYDEPPPRILQRYLEVRLASKALVTGKVGGGANYQVLQLKSLSLRECLKDLTIYAGQPSEVGGSGKSNRRKAEDLSTDLIESLASIVEFDGLETTLDPSPRSSLTIKQYTPQKGKFVKRTLSERVLPTCKALIRLFGSDVEKRCVSYIQSSYPDEVPPVVE